jgi:murein L,D-transpeptidase YcbB/YkuD
MSRTESVLCALAAVTILASPVVAQDREVRDEIQRRMQMLNDTGALVVRGEPLAGVVVIPIIYENRGFEPLWSDPARAAELERLIRGTYQEGLDPEDYHATPISQMLSSRDVRERADPDLRADLDLLLTDGFIRLAYHLRFGKVNPYTLDDNWNLNRSVGGNDPAELFQEALASDSLEEFLREALPREVFYEREKEALARYRRYRDAGGWPTVPDGPVLKPGMRDERVPVLRERLAITGDFSGGTPDDPLLYDGETVDAVLRFQGRHRLSTDGVVGKGTLAALNVPVEKRIEQLRVNMERSRWVFDDIVDDFVLVNIAGFHVYLVRDHKPVWSSRVQVGKTYRRTPVFKSTMKYLVFNPTWTVPPTILRKDVLPAIQKDRSYLDRKNMRVLDRSGDPVDPASLDWGSYSGSNFPYILRQDPGSTNALGRVKFIFPNEHFVFLHDTPHKGGFARAERAFSSGCIRVEKPFELAELLLDDPEKWNSEAIDELLASEKTKTVYLPEPMTVMLLYWTAFVEEEGRVVFIKDLYGRDDRIAEGLDGEFEFHAPEGLPERYRQ